MIDLTPESANLVPNVSNLKATDTLSQTDIVESINLNKLALESDLSFGFAPIR